MARIVLIEDDKPIQELYRITLDAMGHEVSIAEDGRSGLDLVESVDPHVVLLDIMMPVMDGNEYLTAARQKKLNKPTIVLTNLSYDEVKHLKENDDVEDIFIKVETSPSLVADRVNKVLQLG